jgi:monoamine oxidase
MARTPLARALETAAAEAAAEHGTTRRQLLQRAGAAGALAAAGSLPFAAREARAASVGRVVVVGGGLAGLSAADQLRQAGIVAELHEANPTRLGGRCWTGRGEFEAGQMYEHGGELIDQSHTAIRKLAQGLGLNLVNLLSAEQNGTEVLGYFDGAPYPEADIVDELKACWQKIHADVSAASYPTLFDSYTQRGFELDHMSIIDWIEESVPGGIDSRLGQLLDVAYNIEYGAECSEQSSLNLLYLLGYSGQGQLRIFGPSNEKYHVVGGNDQIPARLADRLAGQITMGSALVAVARTPAGAWDLTFQQGMVTKTIRADHAVFALPFSILRSSVDLTKAGFSPTKMVAIREQGMGTNSKLHVQFRSRHWNGLGSNGETFADTGYQNTWEVSRGQAGTQGLLVDYTGGKIGASFDSGTPASRAKQFLGQIEPVLPGLTPQWNGRATIDHWPSNPYTKGSYSYWKVGQYTKFSGIEGRPEGTAHFCGEHTSQDFQGYLNGAVETGQRAAAEVIAAAK